MGREKPANAHDEKFSDGLPDETHIEYDIVHKEHYAALQRIRAPSVLFILSDAATKLPSLPLFPGLPAPRFVLVRCLGEWRGTGGQDASPRLPISHASFCDACAWFREELAKLIAHQILIYLLVSAASWDCRHRVEFIMQMVAWTLAEVLCWAGNEKIHRRRPRFFPAIPCFSGILLLTVSGGNITVSLLP